MQSLLLYKSHLKKKKSAQISFRVFMSSTGSTCEQETLFTLCIASCTV